MIADALWRWPISLAMRNVLIALYIGVNLSAVLLLTPPNDTDWELWKSLPESLATGQLYRERTFVLPEGGSIVVWFAWSPVAGWLFAAISHIGYLTWAAMHFAAVLLLRDRMLIILTVTSWAFWHDTVVGAPFVFVFVAGAMALRGSRMAIWISLGLVLLMPRPTQLPLAAWLLWHDRSLWRPFIVAFIIHAGAVAVSSYGPAWVEAAFAAAASPPFDMGPRSLFGHAWLLLGPPIAVLLASQGRIGWASLAASAYVLPQYLLLPLWELIPGRRRD
jgi:hypothetical protein